MEVTAPDEKIEANQIPQPGFFVDEHAQKLQQAGSQLKDAEAANTGSPGARLWRDSNFNIFWTGQTLDALGSSSVAIILPLLVLEATNSVVQMGVITAIMGMANLMSSLVSGVIVDRLDRRKIMVYCDISRTLFYSLILVSWWLLGPTLWPIYVITAITAWLTTSFMVAYNTAISNLVDQDQITDANGRLQATASMAYVVGPILAGFTSRNLNPALAIGLISMSYLVSAILMLQVRLHKTPADMVSAGESEKVSRFKESLAGVRFLLTHPVLKPVVLIVSIFVFITGATIDLSIFRLKRDLQVDDHIIGTIYGLASLGAIFGAVIAPSMRRRWGFGFCFLMSIGLTSLAIGLTGIVPNVIGMASMALIFTFGTIVRTIVSTSIRQQVTPDHLLGRVSSAYLALMIIGWPIGTVAGTVMAEKTGVPFTLLVIGALGVALTVVGLFTAANTRRPEDAPGARELHPGFPGAEAEATESALSNSSFINTKT